MTRSLEIAVLAFYCIGSICFLVGSAISLYHKMKG